MAYESPERNSFNVSSPTPAKQKFSLMKSFASIFSKKQNTVDSNKDEDGKLQEKVLKPSGMPCKRGREIVNLKDLI